MSARTIVGIDLGTTFSLVATLRDGVPTVVPNALGELLTPSAVSVDADGSLLVGAPARARASTHPEATFRSFKRDMGTDRRFEVGARSMSAPELSALVLAALKQDAEAALGCEVSEAVVTVPAYFGDLQRQATRDAGAIAGLRVERIINEPTAAALAYGLHRLDRELRIAVLDLGGGTFDVTILEIVEGVIEIQSSAGDVRLGGDDFDRALAERIASRVARAHGLDVRHDPRAWARVVEAAEQAKKRLSTADVAGVALVGLSTDRGDWVDVELSVAREEADDVWTPLLERLRAPIARALGDAGVEAQRVDEVLLVGGATRMPCVARLAAQTFGRLPLRTLPADEAVAMGACVQAALKAGDEAVAELVVTDVAPFSLGIETASQFGGRMVNGVFSPVLERGTVIPASRVQRFSASSAGQQEIRVAVYQGEHSLCRDNQLLGSYVVRDLPTDGKDPEAVDVRFTYDLNGILEVETTILSTGRVVSTVIERTPGRLTEGEIRAARAEMRRLKLHPRDALPNTTAIARADALFMELSGGERASLGELIAAFRAALESQEHDTIAAARRRLVELTAALRQTR